MSNGKKDLPKTLKRSRSNMDVDIIPPSVYIQMENCDEVLKLFKRCLRKNGNDGKQCRQELKNYMNCKIIHDAKKS